MLDEMAIKRHVSLDGFRYCGFVDFGNGIEDDSSPVAKDALVFMAVHVNGSWKVPFAYFFIDGLSGSERANLVKICIERLSDVGIKVCSVICDGPSCHFNMLSHLAAQVLSSSVADAIDFCRDVVKMKQFEGSEATVIFIRTFDHFFDVLNSRNPFAKGYKSALRVANKSTLNGFLDMAFEYILGLKDASGQKMYTTRRKTGFVGFLVAIKSTKGLFHDLVESENAPMKYLLMYKFSQDHLELFIGAIRSAGGFNNNPNAQQFTAAYKRLLMSSSIKGSQGNCIKQDATEVLHLVDDSYNDKNNVSLSNAALIRKYDQQERIPIQSEHDYHDSPNFAILSEYKEAAVSYIAGNVARMAEKRLLCMDCCAALGSKHNTANSRFLALKNRGGLFKPTQSVIAVCKETEKSFSRMLVSTGGNLPQCAGLSP